MARRKWNVRDRGTGLPEPCGKTFPGHIFNFQVLLKPRGIRKGFECRRLGRLSAKRQGKSYDRKPCQCKGKQESAREPVGWGRSETGHLYFGKRQCVQWVNRALQRTPAQVRILNASFISCVTLIRLFNSLGLFPLLKAGTTTMYIHYGGRRTERVHISSSEQAK